MDKFDLNSKFSPSKDQQNAINNIVNAFKNGAKYSVLLGVTGSEIGRAHV